MGPKRRPGSVTDVQGFHTVASASPHETPLVEQTVNASFLADNPERLIGDAAYDSDGLDQTLSLPRIQFAGGIDAAPVRNVSRERRPSGTPDRSAFDDHGRSMRDIDSGP